MTRLSISVIYDIWNLGLLNEMKMCTFTKSIICFCANYTIMTRRVFILPFLLTFIFCGRYNFRNIFCGEAWLLIIETSFVVIPEAVQICKLRAHVWFRIFYKNSAKLFNFPEKNVNPSYVETMTMMQHFEIFNVKRIQLFELQTLKTQWYSNSIQPCLCMYWGATYLVLKLGRMPDRS